MPDKTKTTPPLLYEDEMAYELATFFFGLWQKGYRHLKEKNKNESNKAAALPAGFTHKGGLPAGTTAT